MQRLFDIIEEFVVLQLAAGHVDGERELRPALVTPSLALGSSRGQHPASDGHDVAALLQHRHELVGGDGSQFRVFPSQERLDSDQRPRLLEQRLIVNGELASSVGQRELVGQTAPTAALGARGPR